MTEPYLVKWKAIRGSSQAFELARASQKGIARAVERLENPNPMRPDMGALSKSGVTWSQMPKEISDDEQ